MTTASDIQTALSCLIGLPMWSAGWAGDIAWFTFGAPVQRPDYRGRVRTVGEHAVHVSGPWSWQTDSGFVRADETAPPASLAKLGDGPPVLASLTAGMAGDLVLTFNDGDVLQIDGVQSSKSEDEVEAWRFFQPGRQTPHLVASSSGIEWHEA